MMWLKYSLPCLVLAAASSLPAVPQDGIGVPYRMPADGQLMLGLFDAGGRLLRWVAKDEHRFVGELREPWDGLDQWGQPVPAGDYRLKAAYHGPLAKDARRNNIYKDPKMRKHLFLPLGLGVLA